MCTLAEQPGGVLTFKPFIDHMVLETAREHALLESFFRIQDNSTPYFGLRDFIIK